MANIKKNEAVHSSPSSSVVNLKQKSKRILLPNAK